MSKTPLDEILERLHKLQAELEDEIERLLLEKRQVFRYTLEKGKVRFEQGMKAIQRHQKIALWRYISHASLKHLMTAPIIYSLIIPLCLLDLMVSIYQQICFRAYGIDRVKRQEYFVIDRQHLAYLNLLEKFNCVYCGYANGLIEYTREISARTEQYWCPIKHARRTPDPHHMVENFADYGDASVYRKRLSELRKELRGLKSDIK